MAPDTTNTTRDTAMSMQGPSNDKTMKQAIDWIHKHAGKGKYANVDASRLMTAGFSCGGLEAAYNFPDPRVATVGIVSSGIADADKTYLASTWKKPVLYVLGGAADQATPNVSSSMSIYCVKKHFQDTYTTQIIPFATVFCSRILANMLTYRVTATSRTFPPVLPSGRESFLSAMEATFGTPTAVYLAKLCSTGHCGTSRVQRMLLSISRADGRLMDGMRSLRT